MRRAVVVLLALAATASATAEAPAPQGPLEFPTMAEAATYALSVAYSLSPYYEYGGVITQAPDGKFVDSYPVTNYHGDSIYIDEDYSAYDKGYPVVATYHTHPCLPASHFPGMFSPQDIGSARVTMRVSFMGDLCTGKVHEFNPALDKPDQAVNIFDKVTAGRIVGQFTVSGTPLEKTS